MITLTCRTGQTCLETIDWHPVNGDLILFSWYPLAPASQPKYALLCTVVHAIQGIDPPWWSLFIFLHFTEFLLPSFHRISLGATILMWFWSFVVSSELVALMIMPTCPVPPSLCCCFCTAPSTPVSVSIALSWKLSCIQSGSAKVGPPGLSLWWLLFQPVAGIWFLWCHNH